MMTIDEDSLQKMFPLPSTVVGTSGVQHGIILKFKTFYLKLYDDKNNSYLIQGFRYNNQIPIFERNVADSKMREFAKQFSREDYLIWFETR